MKKSLVQLFIQPIFGIQRLFPSLIMLMHVCLVDTFQPLHISTSSFLTCRNNCKTFSHNFFEVSLEKNYLALDILLYIEKYSKSDPKSAEKKWAFLELLPNMGSTYTQYIQTPSTTKSQSEPENSYQVLLLFTREKPIIRFIVSFPHVFIQRKFGSLKTLNCYNLLLAKQMRF